MWEEERGPWGGGVVVNEKRKKLNFQFSTKKQKTNQ